MVRVESVRKGGSSKYTVGGATDAPVVPPDFSRTFSALGDRALLEEIELGKGGADFQEAARLEARRRGIA